MLWQRDGDFLVHVETGYDIPVANLVTSDGCLSWIDHVAEKRWATPQVMQDLVRSIWRLP